ncbi:xanthine dehydrogenase accessory protein XdhC [Anaeromyxobacter diazotrophicus]|uniref:Xanthine dehydrogenase accessory protein XdhC n=1 Tax=Anaeromyxobacter diazotrophicus TaxID=2590199 RepID=A0A7I9VR59_9BACT|nr:xanthine dehydrogenase accessory protein XdhC [Anaeromyxobacter diazotrophicus]GEJ58916.1 xanthine dehydrogenase accessory protein XdhC [Anaeromyxobacter diazotrophicus]
MTGWVAALAELAAAERPAALVTLLRVAGSTPREPGAKLVVTAEALHGTIGGGHLELTAVETARELLAAAARDPGAAGPLVRELQLGPTLGQCCGGVATLLFELVLPPPWQVAVFGAGHVGKALVKLLADLPCRVSWVDAREGEFPAALPASVRRVVTDAPEDALAALPAGADVVVMTHSHALDFQLVEAALRRGDLGYVGLIGSRTKRARFVSRLASRGRTEAELARLTCPIGLPGVGGKLPAEIALAAAAQLLQRRTAAAACLESEQAPARSGGSHQG